MDYPTLAIGISMDKYSEEPATEVDVQSKSESGYVQIRRRVTRVLMKHHIEYENMSSAEKATLKAFWESAIGVGFNWQSPAGTALVVKFITKPKFSGVDAGGLYHNCSFDLVEQ